MEASLPQSIANLVLNIVLLNFGFQNIEYHTVYICLRNAVNNFISVPWGKYPCLNPSMTDLDACVSLETSV